MVAAAEALQHRHPAAAQHADLARLRARPGSRARRRPPSVGTCTVAPSAACVIVRSTVEKRSSPSRDEARVGQDADLDVEVARRGRRARPRGPRRSSRIRWPSWMPGGISTVERALLDAPAAALADRGRDARSTSPEPEQLGHARTRRTRRRRSARPARRWPLPPHVSHVCACFPGSTPLPAQTSHGSATGNGTEPRGPVRRLDELDLDLRGDVGAAALAPARAPAAEEVVAEEGGEDVGQVAEVEVRRLEAAAAQPRVAVAVVELRAPRASRAPRTPRRPRGSAPRRRAPSETSGMERAREPAERLLDLGVVGVARDAENLVVVALGRRHQSKVSEGSGGARRAQRSS